MIDVLKSELLHLQFKCGIKMRDMMGATITIRPENTTCPQCQEEMGVKNSYIRKLITEKYGNVSARIITLICNQGCQTADGSAVLRSPEIIARIAPKGSSISYDIEVEVGLLRYLKRNQREEIQEYLMKKGIPISTGKITNLSHTGRTHDK